MADVDQLHRPAQIGVSLRRMFFAEMRITDLSDRDIGRTGSNQKRQNRKPTHQKDPKQLHDSGLMVAEQSGQGKGFSTRLRNSTNFPSACNPIVPEVAEIPVTVFSSTPLTRTVMVSARQTTSQTFHSPSGFSELAC